MDILFHVRQNISYSIALCWSPLMPEVLPLLWTPMLPSCPQFRSLPFFPRIVHIFWNSWIMTKTSTFAVLTIITRKLLIPTAAGGHIWLSIRVLPFKTAYKSGSELYWTCLHNYTNQPCSVLSIASSHTESKFHFLLLLPNIPPYAILLHHFLPNWRREQFEVGYISDCQYRKGKLEYLIHQKGYPGTKYSWEVADDVHSSYLFWQFHFQCPQKPISPGGLNTQNSSPANISVIEWEEDIEGGDIWTTTKKETVSVRWRLLEWKRKSWQRNTTEEISLHFCWLYLFRQRERGRMPRKEREFISFSQRRRNQKSNMLSIYPWSDQKHLMKGKGRKQPLVA